MTPEEGYREAEQRIAEAQKSGEKKLNLSKLQLTKIPAQIAQISQLQSLWLENNQIVEIPDTIAQLSNLQILWLNDNQIVEIPDAIAQLSNLKELYLFNNQIVKIPDAISQLSNLQDLYLRNNQIVEIPDAISQLSNLQGLHLKNNQIVEIPDSISQLSQLKVLNFDNNPLNPALAAVYKQGLSELKNYLRERAKSQITLNEGKLILVGEGEVGKSCLLGALRGDEWIEGRPTTHGIEIKACQLEHNATKITLNAWDFGGQPVYRPTHQLFFSAPAIYLVVWKPREGPQQGFVDYWITLIKRRAPEAKIIVVATHGGPN
jgi:hypothetical protein